MTLRGILLFIAHACSWRSKVEALPFGASVYLPMESMVSGKVLGGSYSGTASGASVALVDGKLGKALHFGATGSTLDLGEIRDSCFGDLDLCSSGYSLAFWINRAPTNVAAFYISNGGQTYASFGINVSAKPNGILHFALKTRTQWYRLDSAEIPMGSWHHIVMTWDPATLLEVYVDGKHIGSSAKVADDRPGSDYNNFYFGKPNNGNDYFGEAYIDEMLCWYDKKQAGFVQDLFLHYQNVLALQFQPQSSFQILAHSEFGAQFVDPIMQCTPPKSQSANAPNPCRLQCMWFPWCGAVVDDGVLCKYYNVYFPQEITSASTDSEMFVKQ